MRGEMLARGLVAAFAGVLPSRFALVAEGAWVTVLLDGERLSSATGVERLDECEPPERDATIESAAWSVMSHVQDCVLQFGGEIWPASQGYTISMPYTRVDGKLLLMWYGESEESPALRLPSLNIAAMR